MELLFDNKRSYNITLPRHYSHSDMTDMGFVESNSEKATPTDLRFLIHWLLHCMLVDKKRPDLFAQGDTVYVSTS